MLSGLSTQRKRRPPPKKQILSLSLDEERLDGPDQHELGSYYRQAFVIAVYYIDGDADTPTGAWPNLRTANGNPHPAVEFFKE